MQVCTSLRFLNIDNCGGLISLLPILKFLTTLEALIIENCEKLDLIEMEDNQDDFPTSLRALRFIGLPQLVAMPNWIKRSANSLQILVIESCPNLTAFPEWLTFILTASGLNKLIIRLADCVYSFTRSFRT
ncbi:hypothetical protein CMV_026016 [Castanea mollissima]|uniref:Disease resistance protein At4g27190-like leucine-rich repeats domain-containing protein n=1 Tax=Castanea mollissima TaxID=60419 RepID=A0A8J4VAU7_9ROSI|nr:hypothetical protein CMV_026016 [Castanea mollissima]